MLRSTQTYTLLFSAALAFLSLNASAATRVGDFALLDQTGKFHQLSYYGDFKHVVIVLHKQAETTEHYARLEALAEQHTDTARFFWLNPAESREVLSSSASKLPVLLDDAQLVAQSIGATKFGEVLVVRPADQTLEYRGDINSDAGVKALGKMLEGVATPSTAPQGTNIAYSAHAEPISYQSDIAPILTKHCVSCHHDGGIGPWSMSDHNMLRGWAPMMREVVMTRRMPPGQVDGHLTKPLLEVAGLSVEEKQKLVRWIDAGSPRDGDTDPLQALRFDNAKFTLGEPDLVYKVPAQSIPATGVLDYRYIPVQLDLEEDVWVRAMEFVPGDRQVLHHVIAYVSSPADKTVRGRETGAARGESIGGFAPGRQPEQFRDDSGRLLRKGSSLLLQMHYTTSGKPAVDVTEIGIYLHDKPPAYVMSGGVAGQRRFLVPPGAKEHKLQGVQEIERDAYLYAMNPHMHYRGKYMSYTAEYPDGRSELLLSVPKYDFNWQFNYELAEPVFLPAGTRLIANGAMDNSDRNPGNPDPTRPVHFGLQTKHEMFFGFTTLRYAGDQPKQEGDETQKVAEAANLKGDNSAGQ